MGKQASEQMRRTVLQRLEESELNAAEFCRRQGLCYATVLRWRREAANGRRRSSFVEVEVEVAEAEHPDDVAGEEGVAPSLCAEVTFPGGTMLRIYGTDQTATAP